MARKEKVTWPKRNLLNNQRKRDEEADPLT
jgi:hypothetical protein